MNPMRRRLTASATAVALAVTLAACSSSTETGDSPTTEESSQSTAATHNDADIQFAQLMIMHHQGAIEMAEVAIDRASTPEVKALAQRIQAAQGPEIDLMTGWLDSWGEESSHDMGMNDMDMGGMDMDGMSQDEVMDELDDLDGAEFDRAFLERMVAHHRGAIEMSEQEKAEGLNPDAMALAGTIIDAQTAEITEMQNLLAGL
ncbi:DUF305 domain-containing protein [Cellulomonas terrae]|uniref:DUF305 domain-containing protein n=1 Tax=Cellulomonas terrae TaxID=311234 RepID=A0A511JHL7_9CELL|nr:DUF305 domain-containing protein [Cellulomonas terrae]GEL97319.1 hypothetical protein CTE05_08660 [Cellulomonas terrae]